MLHWLQYVLWASDFPSPLSSLGALQISTLTFWYFFSNTVGLCYSVTLLDDEKSSAFRKEHLKIRLHSAWICHYIIRHVYFLNTFLKFMKRMSVVDVLNIHIANQFYTRTTKVIEICIFGEIFSSDALISSIVLKELPVRISLTCGWYIKFNKESSVNGSGLFPIQSQNYYLKIAF